MARKFVKGNVKMAWNFVKCSTERARKFVEGNVKMARKFVKCSTEVC